MNFLNQDSIDEYKAKASHLLDVAQEYELDNSGFARKLRESRDEKVARINKLIHEILDEIHLLDDHKDRASNYLLDMAQEYELGNPEFARKLREFRDEKVAKTNELIHEILDKIHALGDYTSHVER